MYLIDTNAISELRKGKKANNGVRQFFDTAMQNNTPLYMSVITVGELQRGVDLIFHRGDTQQGEHLEHWLATILEDYKDNVLGIDAEPA